VSAALDQGRKRDIETSSLPLEQRLEARRDALREMRKSITNAYRELRPQAFGEWLQDRAEELGSPRASILGDEAAWRAPELRRKVLFINMRPRQVDLLIYICYIVCH